MSVQYISVNLIAHFSNGNKVPHDIFLGKLLSDKTSYEYSKSKKAWQSAQITLFKIELSKFKDEEEPSESFSEEVKKELNTSAQWLDSIANQIFKDFLETDLNIKIIISSWIDSDQFDLDIPSSFIKACSEKELSLSIITND